MPPTEKATTLNSSRTSGEPGPVIGSHAPLTFDGDGVGWGAAVLLSDGVAAGSLGVGVAVGSAGVGVAVGSAVLAVAVP
ncbi:hypothetical protein, partial [Micromonospora sp. BL1]|uniref:hypothetical protein n=1 Tax=Micromonospora sp. BL1 TaxID=2478709 RepID=UPI0018F2A459